MICPTAHGALHVRRVLVNSALFKTRLATAWTTPIFYALARVVSWWFVVCPGEVRAANTHARVAVFGPLVLIRLGRSDDPLRVFDALLCVLEEALLALPTGIEIP